MFIDLKKIHAAASASFCVRSILASVVVCCGVLSALPAHSAGQDRRDDNRDNRDNRSQQSAPRQEQSRQLDPRSYESRAEEQRRAMQENNRNAEMSRRVGRMTADERRDLRRH